MENMYSQYEGNRPVIFGDKKQLQDGVIKAIKTDAPFIADKVMDYKKEIWNEALTYLGINNIMINKKERLITAEVESNDIEVKLWADLALEQLQKGCKKANELFELDLSVDWRYKEEMQNDESGSGSSELLSV